MEWPVKKIPLNRSVHGIEYHPEMQVYALLTSTPIDFILRDENGESVETEQGNLSHLYQFKFFFSLIYIYTFFLPIDSVLFLPETQKFVLELISPITWETVDRL